ncbi:hypothetical protein F975_00483 [Acinetobacter sp. ANC 3789]|uniref:YagK/YfjJ domain-containing protein n=1 Tax=Acinetobacter sp. ANC 3789 TaxID=1217714 RepID=UPI0002D0126C|nr:inovirus-type Gp2 protein [Acinetobacter sp. ANC 3789]ENU81867.1 hypothetical protein F975_00483 [Acinetobacter sp. ANC 3789]
MKDQIDIEQKHLCNLVELTTEQTGNGFLKPTESSGIETLSSIVLLAHYIQQESSNQVYQLSYEGKCLYTSDPVLDSYLRGIHSIEILKQTPYWCKEAEIFSMVFNSHISPYILEYEEHLFWRAQTNLKFEIYGSNNYIPESSVRAAKLKNILVDELSKTFDSLEYRAFQYTRNLKVKRQYKKMLALIKRLLQLFNHILIIRLDLGWNKSINPCEISVSQMRANFTKFLGEFRYSKYLPNIVGYLWKLQFSKQKGYHYHCMFFIDGNTFQRHTDYAEIIGQYWKTMTENKGYFLNCINDLIKHRRFSIGLIQYGDHNALDILKQALLYICKQDQFLIHKQLLDCNLRVFQTSIPPLTPMVLGRFRTLPSKQNIAISPAITD